MADDDAITPEEERQLEGLLDRLKRQVKSGKLGLELVLLQLEEITHTLRDALLPTESEIFHMMAQRRQWFECWYEKLGFNVSIPFLFISDEEFARRFQKNEALFYRPPTTEVSYQKFMKAVGYGIHWTTTSIVRGILEPTDTGYWFWAEVAPRCPRLDISPHAFTDEIEHPNQKLISLEEYVIVWFAMIHIDQDSQRLDDDGTSSLLRNEYSELAMWIRWSAFKKSLHVATECDVEFSPETDLHWVGCRAVEIVTETGPHGKISVTDVSDDDSFLPPWDDDDI